MNAELETTLSCLREALKYIECTDGTRGELYGCAVSYPTYQEWMRLAATPPVAQAEKVHRSCVGCAREDEENDDGDMPEICHRCFPDNDGTKNYIHKNYTPAPQPAPVKDANDVKPTGRRYETFTPWKRNCGR